MAEGKPRTRRAERHQTPPDRVTEAARQMQQPQEPMPQMQQNGYGGFPQNEAWPQPNTARTAGGPAAGMPSSRLSTAAGICQQQYAWQQEQQSSSAGSRRSGNAWSSETSSHGAFRGYTGQTPVWAEFGRPAGPGDPGEAEEPAGLILPGDPAGGGMGTGGLFRHPAAIPGNQRGP